MNRNIYITNNANKNLENYQTILIDNIPQIINGYINNILCECLDQVEAKDKLGILYSIVSKIAFEGSATFKFINGSVLAARILKNEIDSDKLSHVIKDTTSIWTESKIIEVFTSIPNIVISKNYIDNIYTVISINKKI